MLVFKLTGYSAVTLIAILEKPKFFAYKANHEILPSYLLSGTSHDKNTGTRNTSIEHENNKTEKRRIVSGESSSEY